jgi:hypothetical protein
MKHALAVVIRNAHSTEPSPEEADDIRKMTGQDAEDPEAIENTCEDKSNTVDTHANSILGKLDRAAP